MKVFANKKMKQFIIILVTVIMLFNVIAPAPLALQVQAAEVFGSVTSGVVDIGGGLLLLPLYKLAAGGALLFQQLLNGVANIATAIGAGNLQTWQGDVFISTIVYNQLPIVDANIFNPETNNPLLQSKDGSGMSGIVKTWYNITRMMALAASLVILVYVAIKIILSSTGQSKAKYTELLKDWLLSLLLIFSLHYVMAAILFCNDAIVKFFENIVNSGGNTFSYQKLTDEAILGMPSISTLLYTVVWWVFLIMTFVFLVLYIKRLILICFFVIISPIIVILNTINKIRGKGNDLLGNWLKEFIANVVMQPIDALMFTVILSSINICLDANPKQPLVALALLFGYYPLRKWVLKFFDQSSDLNTVEGAKGNIGRFNSSIGRKVAAVAGVASTVSNLKIPKLQDNEKLMKRLDTVSRVGNGVSNIAGQTKKKRLTDSWENDWQNGTGDWSNNTYDKSNAVEAPSSYSNDSATSQTSSVVVGNEDKQPGKGRKALGIAWRATKLVAPKAIGATAGVTAMVLNSAAGNTGNGVKAFKGAMNATETIMRAPGKFIEENGGFRATAKTARQYAIDRVTNSYVATGEHGRYQKQLEESNFWFGDELQAYAREYLAINGTQEEIREYNETDDQKVFLAAYVRNQTRNADGFDRMVAVEGGNVSKIERRVAQRNIDKWKKKGITLNSSRSQVEHTGTNIVDEYDSSSPKVEYVQRNSDTIEVHESGSSGSTVVHRQGNGGTNVVYESGSGASTVVHRQGNGGTNVVYEEGSSASTVVHRQENGGTNVVYEEGNNSGVTEIVDDVEQSAIRDLQEFTMDSKIQDLAYDLIETMGEGDPLYEEYKANPNQSEKMGIALQFLFARAKENWNERDLTDIIRNKNYQELQKLLKK